MRATQQIFRVRREYNQWVANQTLEDYALRFTAKGARRFSAFQISITALGATAFMALEAIGGAITINYGFTNALWAILMVGLVIFVTGLPISYYAARAGVDIDLLTRGAGFGYLGSTITSLIYAAFTFIFFAIEAAILAMALKALFGIPLPISYVICSLAVIPIVTHGIATISRFQVGSHGLWLLLQLAALAAVAWYESDRVAEWTAFQATESPGDSGFNLALFGAASAMMFALVAQIGEQVDYLRFLPPLRSANRRQWWLAMLSAGPGWILVGIVKLLAGSFLAWLAFSAGTSFELATDPTHMYQQAFDYVSANPTVSLWLAAGLVILSQMKINVTNAYAGSIAWSNFFSRVTHSHPGRVVWLVFNVLIALMLMELGIYQALENILGLFAIIAVSWLGTIAADLAINMRLGLRPREIEFKRSHLYDINPVGVGSMLGSAAIGLMCYFETFGPAAQALAHYLTLASTCILAPLLAWYTGGRYYVAREPTFIASSRGVCKCSICENSFESEDMAYCTAYQGDICSLCCSLDGRCQDSCKPHGRATEQLRRWLTRWIPAHVVAQVDSRLGRFLGILSLISAVHAGLLALVYFHIGPQDAAASPVLAEALWTLFFIFLVISGVLAWLFLLNQESRRVAQQESAKQTQLLMAEIGAHRETDQELQAAKELAEAANEAKSRYLTGISHELRTPLQSILGYAQILNRADDIPPQRREQVDVMRRSGDYLADLIEGLLDISKIEAGRLEIHREQADLGALLDELTDMFRMLARNKGIAFNCNVSGALPRYVHTDEKRLRQILINLLSNAVKFTERGKVDFSVSYRNQVAEFAVSDTGPGIAAADLERIFNPFERATVPGQPHVPGTGLGLTIVKLLVELMGGDLTVASEPGQGSRFGAVLMLSAAEGVTPAAEPSKQITGYCGSPRRIMVVDDQPQHRELISDLLGPIGFEVIQALDAGDCLERRAASPVELYLVDVSMPGMNGLELVRELRGAGDRSPVIMISADAEERHGDIDQDKLHNDFMVKPIKLNALLRKMARLLDIEWQYTEMSSQVRLPELLTEPNTDADLSKLRAYAEIGYLKGVKAELTRLRETRELDSASLDHLETLVQEARLEQVAQLLEETTA